MTEIYKISRSPDSPRIFVMGYKGQVAIDSGKFYCPYIPGRPIPEFEPHRPATDLQQKIMEVVYDEPMLKKIDMSVDF